MKIAGEDFSLHRDGEQEGIAIEGIRVREELFKK